MLAIVRAQSPQVEWTHYGSDAGGTRYSPLTDIDAAKLPQLQVAWQWKHWETPLKEYGTTPGQFESTPLMVDGTLYVTTPYNSLAALDAETGKEKWRFDGHAYELGQLLSGSGWKLRGTATWRDGGQLRIFLNSRHRLVQLDAATGKPVASFGNGGAVSLTDGLPRIGDVTHVSQSSPPVVYRDLVIVGSQVPDRVQLPDPMGYVQAFNARTGQRVWAFSTIPQSATDPGRRDVGERVVAAERARQRVGADGARRAARPALPADLHADQRLLRRQSAGRQPVCRIARVPRCRDRAR